VCIVGTSAGVVKVVVVCCVSGSHSNGGCNRVFAVALAAVMVAVPCVQKNLESQLTMIRLAMGRITHVQGECM
jgi:hypothetical protein